MSIFNLKIKTLHNVNQRRNAMAITKLSDVVVNIDGKLYAAENFSADDGVTRRKYIVYNKEEHNYYEADVTGLTVTPILDEKPEDVLTELVNAEKVAEQEKIAAAAKKAKMYKYGMGGAVAALLIAAALSMGKCGSYKKECKDCEEQKESAIGDVVALNDTVLDLREQLGQAENDLIDCHEENKRKDEIIRVVNKSNDTLRQQLKECEESKKQPVRKPVKKAKPAPVKPAPAKPVPAKPVPAQQPVAQTPAPVAQPKTPKCDTTIRIIVTRKIDRMY